MIQLNLKKPLVCFDLETTGLDIGSARIVEISMLKIHVSGKQEILTLRINPEVPIPEESFRIHGISDDDVKDQPTFRQLASKISEFIGSADLSGYNVLRFDLPLLAEEFFRADILFDVGCRSVIDVQNIFHKMEPRTLSAAYRFYCNEELINAHSAEADTIATYNVLLAQLEKYQGVVVEEKGKSSTPVVNDMDLLGRFSIQKKFADLAGHIVYNDKDEPVFNFGKYKGQTVESVFNREPQYYDWIMKSNFPEYTKRIVQILYMKKSGNTNFAIS
jgi:DNA polymerase III subunit epsilon